VTMDTPPQESERPREESPRRFQLVRMNRGKSGDLTAVL
jgi:hypothetical protein